MKEEILLENIRQGGVVRVRSYSKVRLKLRQKGSCSPDEVEVDVPNGHSIWDLEFLYFSPSLSLHRINQRRFN